MEYEKFYKTEELSPEEDILNVLKEKPLTQDEISFYTGITCQNIINPLFRLIKEGKIIKKRIYQNTFYGLSKK